MRAQRIHPAAYGALTEALATVYWYKQDLAKFLRLRSTGHPELIAGLDFDAYKRVFADEFVDRLMADEDRYRDLTLAIMLEIAQMTAFPSLKRQSDAEKLLAQATEAVADLKVWTERLQGLLAEKAKVEAEQAQQEEREAHRRGFSEKLSELKAEFLRLETEPNRQRAGREFETFLNGLFRLFDMQPRLGYELDYEQIDGSFAFDTDDYVLEAKWWKKPAEAGQLREFNDKVRRKGKNALGLFISVKGFTSGARAAFREGTSFLTMDGTDLFCVLDDRVRLDDLLSRKKRHANETGNCYFPAHLMLDE
ncbi:restriction endonuclease [Streptomyces cinerochromogenes]|uniref:restriction endonuclease n=1 Tax=Streptomyces cinerochromogenes TaxID=66422 RepID=UPI001670654F|nr:restriction endonuclease [Streptomyces cinerochromogenes]